MSSAASSTRANNSAGDKERRAERPAKNVSLQQARHARSFKLRFEASHEPGRSYVSLVRPLNLPFTITDKFYSGVQDSAEAEVAEALQLVTARFERGPRERLPAPETSSHEYGWWAREGEGCGGRGDPRLDRRIRDSPWLKERLRVLAADDKLKHK